MAFYSLWRQVDADCPPDAFGEQTRPEIYDAVERETLCGGTRQVPGCILHRAQGRAKFAGYNIDSASHFNSECTLLRRELHYFGKRHYTVHRCPSGRDHALNRSM